MGLRLRRFDPRRLWLSRRGLLALTLAVVAAGVVSVIMLRASAADDLRAGLLASRLQGEVSRVSGLEAQAVGDRAAGARPTTGLPGAVGAATATIGELRELGVDDPVFAIVDEYLRAVERELSLLRQGRIELAVAARRDAVDPLFDRIDPALNAIATARQEQAFEANRGANITAVVAVLLTAAVLAALFWKLQRLREANRRAELERDHYRQLDAIKDSLVATVSHELRTPLSSVMGYTELLLDGHAGPVPAEQQELLRRVDRNGRRLLRLVDDLLLLSRIEAGMLELKRAPVDLASVVHDAADTHLREASSSGVTLTTRLERVAVAGDAARLAQVVDNLLSNAIKFTPRGGRVHVTLARRDSDAVLRVEDTGIGIAADDLPHLFDRFYRTAQAEQQAIQGSGLGLSIVSAIVEAHGGRITIASDPGSGTAFEVCLPTPAPGERDAPALPEPVAAAAGAD